MSLPWLKDNEREIIICLRSLTCSRVYNSYLVQHRSKLYCAKAFVPDKNSSWVQCTSKKQTCIRRIYCIFVKQDSFTDSETCIKWTPREHLQYLDLKEERAWPLYFQNDWWDLEKSI